MPFLLLFFSFFIFSTALPALASAPADLKKIEAKILAEKKEQDALKEKLSSLNKDVESLKSNLIKTTEDVQKFETSTSALESKMSDLELKKAKILDNLQTEREQLAGLLTALERIRRTPPEALIARPDAPLNTAHAAIILKAIIPELNAKADALKIQLRDLDNVETSLIENREELAITAKNLNAERAKMEAMLDLRQKAMDETKDDFDAKKKSLAKLSQDAKDMRQLIRKIEDKQKKAKADAERKRAERLEKAKKAKDKKETASERQKREKQDKIEEAKENRQLASLPALGNARLPLKGTIRTRFGQKDDIGATAEGLRIAGRSGAVVVAPVGGIIRYAGPFKKYGTIILVEHKNNYMSLIAGLGRIDTVEGQRVDAGEPLGTMGSGSTPTLYYELRFKGNPVNPSKIGL